MVQDGSICLLKEDYYSSKILPSEINHKKTRLYLYLTVEFNNLYYAIPFESDLYEKNKVAQYPLPTQNKPNAGLNFEKALVFESNSLFLVQNSVRLPRVQLKTIESNLIKIKRKFERYLQNFIKSCGKNREKKEFAYKYSTLHFYKNQILQASKI